MQLHDPSPTPRELKVFNDAFSHIVWGKGGVPPSFLLADFLGNFFLRYVGLSGDMQQNVLALHIQYLNRMPKLPSSMEKLLQHPEFTQHHTSQFVQKWQNRLRLFSDSYGSIRVRFPSMQRNVKCIQYCLGPRRLTNQHWENYLGFHGIPTEWKLPIRLSFYEDFFAYHFQRLFQVSASTKFLRRDIFSPQGDILFRLITIFPAARMFYPEIVSAIYLYELTHVFFISAVQPKLQVWMLQKFPQVASTPSLLPIFISFYEEWYARFEQIQALGNIITPLMSLEILEPPKHQTLKQPPHTFSQQLKLTSEISDGEDLPDLITDLIFGSPYYVKTLNLHLISQYIDDIKRAGPPPLLDDFLK